MKRIPREESKRERERASDTEISEKKHKEIQSLNGIGVFGNKG